MATADMIITNGAVLTMDPEGSKAEAVGISGGRIVAVGSIDEVSRLAGPATQVIDARGATVLPGFIESHMHLFIGGAELENLQLDGCADLDLLARELTASQPPDRMRRFSSDRVPITASSATPRRGWFSTRSCPAVRWR
jgi:predicted amidohydrolase YtcJ